jgi:hypothetical protein
MANGSATFGRLCERVRRLRLPEVQQYAFVHLTGRPPIRVAARILAGMIAGEAIPKIEALTARRYAGKGWLRRCPNTATPELVTPALRRKVRGWMNLRKINQRYPNIKPR